MADNEVKDGRLIRRPKPEDISAEEQEYWTKLGWHRASIHCQTCHCSAESGLEHMGGGEHAHEFKAKVPGVNYG